MASNLLSSLKVWANPRSEVDALCLKPIEKAGGLAEVYRLVGFEPWQQQDD